MGQNASFICWQTDRVKKEHKNTLDPNFLDNLELNFSPFH